ncbi:DUF2272 domain-containing protein [Falsiroseomonas sp. HW251]|uniref:DUF2272 domain-containing protein n=1 Tax=Falsiroseomonas sp. HW251 TaxID=3390998 RepID=UPI003D31D7F0
MRVLAALLLLGGCATAAAPATPPIPYPPSAAERVVRIATEEWRDWGSPVQPAFEAGPPGSPESDPRNFPRVLAYWRAVPVDYGAIADNRARYRAVLAGAREAIWAEPQWSAAFISWVFRSAGVDAREFPPNATHALYLDALIADAAAFPDTAPFLPNAPEDYAPRPGDLVCRDRSAAPLRRWQDRLPETGAVRPMHCDIVVGVDARERVVRAVGGNVGDAVTMLHFATDAQGRLLPAPPGRAPVVVIMQSRLGRLPPWGNE